MNKSRMDIKDQHIAHARMRLLDYALKFLINGVIPQEQLCPLSVSHVEGCDFTPAQWR